MKKMAMCIKRALRVLVDVYEKSTSTQVNEVVYVYMLENAHLHVFVLKFYVLF